MEKWAERWGVAYDTIRKRSSVDPRGSWRQQRERFWKDVRERQEATMKQQLSDEMSGVVMDANKRHLDEGKRLQEAGSRFRLASMMLTLGVAVCPHCKGEVPVPKGEMKASDAGRTASRMIKDGVDMERKALGLAETVVKLEFAREYGKLFAEVVGKYVNDPAVLRNIQRDLDDALAEDREKLEALAERGETLH